MAMMRVASVDSCNYTFENCINEGVTGGDHEIVGYKQVVFLNGIEENKNMDRVIIYNLDVVKNASRAVIETLNFDGHSIKQKSPPLCFGIWFLNTMTRQFLFIKCYRRFFKITIGLTLLMAG